MISSETSFTLLKLGSFKCDVANRAFFRKRSEKNNNNKLKLCKRFLMKDIDYKRQKKFNYPVLKKCRSKKNKHFAVPRTVHIK